MIDNTIVVKCNKPLRWLLRWGSPLTFPNREVKPNCADGTAVMWESMSPPSFIKRLSEKIASFFCYWYAVFASSVRRLLLRILFINLKRIFFCSYVGAPIAIGGRRLLLLKPQSKRLRFFFALN